MKYYNIYVVMVNYNTSDLTLSCIKSLKKSTIPLKLIVVDNGSVFSEFCKLANNENKNDYILIKNINNGFSGGNNIGIKYALNNNADYISIINNDTEAPPELFENMLKSWEPNALIAPVIYYYDDRDFIWFGGGNINKWTGSAKHMYMGSNKIFSHDFYCSFATGCCWFMSADIWQRIGMLNEKYFMYCEDTDYCLRLNDSKIRIKISVNAKLWHKVSASSGGKITPFQTYYTTRNKIIYIYKFKNYFKFTAIPFTILTKLIRAFQYLPAKVDISKAYVRGVIDGLFNKY